ncbi:MFS transporter [Rhodococcus sp. NPDC059968]|uniref:MFS transporter n=1 Tax=Rhodococcus sp. NPDC059968 TaxID=3347017 RepID=UPI0036703145
MITAATIGHVIEYYDFTLYAIMATTLAPLFFTNQSASTALLSTFAVFAVPFLARPLGGLIFGHFGDRIGRKKVLILTILMIGAGCGLIGLLPTYDTIGVLAPVGLFLLRVVQGISAGGELTGATTFVVESAPQNRRGLFGGILGAGPLVGTASAAGAVLILNTVFTPEQITGGAWRIPFLVAFALTAIALYIRWQLEDSPEFLAAKDSDNLSAKPLQEAIASNPRTVFKIFCVALFTAVNGYAGVVYMVTYLTKTLGHTPKFSSALTSFGFLAIAILIPLFGLWSDRVGRKPVLLASMITAAVLVPSMMWLMGAVPTTIGVIIAFEVMGISQVLLNSVAYTFFAESFPTNVRFSGMAIAFNSAQIVGGLTPFVATYLIQSTGNNLMPGYMVAVSAVIGILGLRGLPETGKSALLKAEAPRRSAITS